MKMHLRKNKGGLWYGYNYRLSAFWILVLSGSFQGKQITA
mgnify:CR=1 FL=1